MDTAFNEDVCRLRDVLLRLKVMRSLDRPVLRLALESDEFEEHIIKPLTELSEWSADDERVCQEKIAEMRDELASTKDVGEKDRKTRQVLKYSGGIIAGITLLTISAVVARALSKKPKT